MAINLATRYPGRANPADTNYPQGSFKNRSAPGVLDGSYLEKDWANDFFAFFQQSLVEAGISPNDTVDNATNSQYYQALKSVFAEKNDFLSIATTAFEASVTDGEAVYWDSANSRYDEAIADGTNKQNMIGFADVTNGRVILMGAYSGQLSGLTPGAKYYLSGTLAGAITTTVPTNNSVLVGIAKNETGIFADVDASGTGTVTAASDPTFVDNSSTAASTSWVRGAMSALAVAAGFSYSFTTNGFIKFPSWFFGFIIEWGSTSPVGSVEADISPTTFPLAFPTACLKVVATKKMTPSVNDDVVVTITSFNSTSVTFRSEQVDAALGAGTRTFEYLAIGH